jgi:hypothetical protein
MITLSSQARQAIEHPDAQTTEIIKNTLHRRRLSRKEKHATVRQIFYMLATTLTVREKIHVYSDQTMWTFFDQIEPYVDRQVRVFLRKEASN